MKSLNILAGLVLTTALSSASIINVGGSGDILTAGPGVGYTPDFFGDHTLVIHGWDEQQSVTLASNVAVDITGPGTYNSPGSLTPGIVAAGTVVNSHAFYFDPAAGGSTTAGFQFDGTIIGVIVDDGAPTDPFVASDFLIPASVPSGNIPTGHFAARGLELGINIDSVIVGSNTIQFALSAGSPGDQVRVLTIVPEPCTLSILAIIGCAGIRRRRQRA
ncbi:MAG: hypothetical protein JSS66_16835 [Armatimonadetes bacterium]|nr:hypothetical protein [Armatimonadota bacterium]